MEGELDEEGRSALEYARHHGLCTRYDCGPLYDSNLITPLSSDFDGDLCDPLGESITNTVNALTKERLAVSKDAARLLKDVCQVQQMPSEAGLTTDWYERILCLKQELPVLRTDSELDLRNFGSAAVPNFKDLSFTLEPVDMEKDEGFEWPTKYFTYWAHYEGQIKAEKLAISRDVLLHLRDTIKDDYTEEDHESMNKENLTYRSSSARRPITPPLLPLSPPLTPYIPSSPANRLPIPSDSEDSFTAEARDCEQQIMEADSLIRKDSDSSDSMLLDIMHPPPFSPPSDERTSIVLKRKVEDLKVEGPLTPPILSDSPMKKLKSVTFSETLHRFIPEAPWAKTFSDDEDSLNDGSDIDFDELFKDIAPIAQKANRKVECEKLVGADTTARVNVPDVDFSLPVAPWKEYSWGRGGKRRPSDTELDCQSKYLLRVKREDLKTATSWHGLSSLERSLPWGILTVKTSKISLDEKLHGETEFSKIQCDITDGSTATSSSQVWKPEGLRILSEDEDEEEIETDEVEERRDVESLIRKRKLEMEEEIRDNDHKRAVSRSPQFRSQPPRDMSARHHWDNEDHVADKSSKIRSKTFHHQEPISKAASSQHRSMQAPNNTGDDLMFGGFSATSALHKFMETRGKATGLVNKRTTDTSRLASDKTDVQTHKLPVRSREQSLDQTAIPTRSLPCLPDIPQHLAPCSFIFSSSFLQQRFLMKQIEQLYQGAEIIYRDYSQPHSPAQEADILLSPSTGVVLTTLQQIKQQPLPGQVNRSPVKDRVKALQRRSERLLVIISEGLNREMESHGSSRPEDVRDKEALEQFDKFASQLEAEVVIQYVPGGQQALARSIIVEMVKYGLPHDSQDIGDIKLMPVETTWEVFLRRVGINPFAAQLTVALLRRPVHVQLRDIASSPACAKADDALAVSGLSAFLLMSEEERVRFFQGFMGGGRILRRVGRLLEQEWVSAAHGFRMG